MFRVGGNSIPVHAEIVFRDEDGVIQNLAVDNDTGSMIVQSELIFRDSEGDIHKLVLGDGLRVQSELVFIDGDGDLQELAVDRVTGALQYIITDHAAIHEKTGYSAYITFDSVANGASRNINILTDPNLYVHLKFYDVWINNAAGLLQLYEGAAVTGGTTVTSVNRNRLGTPPDSVETIVHTATVNTTGAILLETLRFGGGGTGPQGRAGGDRSMDVEWVLKQEEDYTFIITNQSGVAANIGVWIFWYEESDG